MGKIKKYQNFLSESNREEESRECLDDFIKEDGEFYEFLSKELSKRGLDLMEIESESEDSFYIRYETREMGGRFPNRLSSYIEEIKSSIEKLIPTTFIEFWSFGKNGRCDLVDFFLKDSIDPDVYYKAKKARLLSQIC